MGGFLSRRADEIVKSSLPLHIHHLLRRQELIRVGNWTRSPLKSLYSPNPIIVQISSMGSIGAYESEEEKEEKSLPLPLLPEDIMRVEILTRLPVKSLVQFRCVCKDWNFLLTYDTKFIKSHLTRTLNDPKKDGIIVRFSSRRHWFKKESHPLLSVDLQVVGSINGLVCVYLKKYGSISEIGIWNPAINRYKYIPSPPKICSKGVAFDYYLGFGFDPIENDYKVIYVKAIMNQTLVARVYSCNAGSWGNNIVTSTFTISDLPELIATVVDGRPYWYTFYGNSEHRYIISFDVGREVFKLLPAPDFVNLVNYYDLVNLRDSLAVITVRNKKHEDAIFQEVDVYILDETSDDCAWTKSYTIFPITIKSSMILLQCFQNGDLLFMDEKDEFKLVSIDPDTHQVNGFHSVPSPLVINFPYSFDYIESLEYVKGMNQIPVSTDASNILIIE